MNEQDQDQDREVRGLSVYSVEDLLEEASRRLSGAQPPPLTARAQELLHDLSQYKLPKQSATQEPPVSELSKQAEELVAMLQTKGKGVLHGKLDGAWFDKQAQSKPKKYAQGGWGFSDQGVFGGLDNQSTSLLSAMSPASAAASQIYTWGDDSGRDTHYFIESQPFAGTSEMAKQLKLGSDKTYRQFCHLMWSYRDFTPDNRGHHILLKFSFVLPEAEAQEFSTQAQENPDLLEAVFQGLYPGLVERGLQRVQTNQVRFITLKKNQMDQNEKIAFGKQAPTLPAKSYSRIVGEQPK